MSERHHGSCLCGAVKYQVNGSLRPVIACHCVQCRKTSGHYGAATSAARGDLRIAGAVKWYASSDTAKRGFCPDCGSSMFWDGGGDNVSIWAGTLEGRVDVRLAGHIYVADKGAYYEINDDVPMADQGDAALTTK